MQRVFGLVALTTILVGCGGGGGGGSTNGGGGGGGSIPTVQFTSWSDTRPNTEIVAPTISTTATYTENSNGDITSVSEFSSFYGGEFRETFDANGAITSASITTSDGDRLTFSKPDGAQYYSIFDGAGFLATNSTETSFVIGAEPVPQGWNYQTFGVWSRSPTSSASGMVGASSTGAFTQASNIPTSGTASFQGIAAGLYQLSEFSTYITSADMTLNVDFRNRTADFQTVNSVVTPDVATFASSYPAIDLTGIMQLDPTRNSMSGTVESRFGMKGVIQGAFYGPNAQEVGGTFGLRGDGVESYVGGFGGKR